MKKNADEFEFVQNPYVKIVESSSPEPEPEAVPRVDLGNRTSGLFGGLPGQLPARPRQVREKSATPPSDVDESESSYEYYDETGMTTIPFS